MIKWIALGVIAGLVLLFIFAPVLAWILVGLVALLIAFVLFVPIGADVGYIDKQFRLALRVDGFAFQLLPKKHPDQEKPKEEPKPKEEKKEPEPKEEKKPKKSLNFTKEEILEIIKKAFKGLRKFGKLTVRKFMLHYTAAGVDPYYTAKTFSYVNGGLSALAPICARTFRCGDVDVWTDIDFTANWMTLETELSITLRLIQVVRAAIAAGIGVLGVLLKRKKRLKKEEELAKKNGSPAADTEEAGTEELHTEETGTEKSEPEEAGAEKTETNAKQASNDQVNNQPEERNDNNGDNNG